jgi:hypothetical protein
MPSKLLDEIQSLEALFGQNDTQITINNAHAPHLYKIITDQCDQKNVAVPTIVLVLNGPEAIRLNMHSDGNSLIINYTKLKDIKADQLYLEIQQQISRHTCNIKWERPLIKCIGGAVLLYSAYRLGYYIGHTALGQYSYHIGYSIGSAVGEYIY